MGTHDRASYQSADHLSDLGGGVVDHYADPAAASVRLVVQVVFVIIALIVVVDLLLGVSGASWRPIWR